jgi:protein tyrosine kinase modulator
LQVHQYQDTIAQATRNQQRIEEQIKTFQGRVALSPAIEEQYKELTRDYDSAQKTYNDLLTKKSQADTQLDMERDQQGEQMRVLRPADLPDSPSFPNRLLFAGGGLAGGLVIGMGLAMWFEFRDQLVRTEDDVVAILELPVLSQVPWLGTGASPKYGKTIKPKTEKETVEV